MSLFEQARDAVSVLIGLKRAVQIPTRPQDPQRIGSPAVYADDDLVSLSKSYEFFRSYTHLEPDRQSIYNDVDEMFLYVLISAALEAYIEDALQEDIRTDKVIQIKSANPSVQSQIERLFRRIELDERLTGDLWNLGKYGDYFSILLYNKKDGIIDARPVEPRICHRHEDFRRVLRGFTLGDQSEADAVSGEASPRYKPWDMIHWRLRRYRPMDPYGTPFFINIRLTYKVLKLMEEQMTIYRMNMHPDRLIFKVFTGSMNPEERMRAVKKWRKQMEKIVSINHSTGKMISEYAPWCLTGDTKVALLDGTSSTIKELADGTKGKEYWVYSYDTQKNCMVPGRGHSAGIVRKNAPIVKVSLDNGESVRCTPEHRFLLRDGKTYKMSKDLVPGDSLMPLYRDEDQHGYERLYEPGSEAWLKTHRWVGEYLWGESMSAREGDRFKVVHHSSFDHRNNDPRVLALMWIDEHICLHASILEERWKDPEYRKKMDEVRRLVNEKKWIGERGDLNCKKASSIQSETWNLLWSYPEYRSYWQSLIESEKVGWATSWKDPEFAAMMSKYGVEGKIGWGHHWKDPDFRKKTCNAVAESNKRRFATPEGRDKALANLHRNHKVVSVEPCGSEDVYCLTVDGVHNFSLEAGVVVANSVDQNIYWPIGTNEDKSGVEKFPGSANAGDLFDVHYMRDLLFAGTRVPKAYMGFEDSQGYRSTDTLSQQSVKFARGVKRLRKPLLQGYTRLCRIHLELQGIDSSKPENSFDLSMTPINYLEETQKAEFYSKRFETVNFMLDLGEKMSQSIGVDKKRWATYVLGEFGGFDEATIASLFVPAPGQPADIVFEPSGKVVTFEGRGLTPDQEEYIRKSFEDNPKLHEAINSLLKYDALMPSGDSVSSISDSREGGSIGCPRGVDSDRGIIEEAFGKNRDAEKKVAEESRTRVTKMREELRKIAQDAQKENGKG